MKFAGAYSLHNGQAEWERRELSDWLSRVMGTFYWS